ncbi:MAG: XRE family transcriptional regulator [Promethearchaeota archaeon]
MLKIYISGALTPTNINNPEELKNFYEKIAKVCNEQGFIAYLPHLNTDPIKFPQYSPKDVYKINTSKILESTFIIAYVGIPSLGVGSEIEFANQHKIPIILLYEKNRRISRHIRGTPLVQWEIKFISHKDCINQIIKFLKNSKIKLIKETR